MMLFDVSFLLRPNRVSTLYRPVSNFKNLEMENLVVVLVSLLKPISKLNKSSLKDTTVLNTWNLF